MDKIGHYKVVELLGAGGMGSVYKVRHDETGMLYALKTPLTDRFSPGLRLRFKRECRVVAA